MSFEEVRVLIVPADYERSLRFWTDSVGLAAHEAFDDGAGALLDLGPGVRLELLAPNGDPQGGGPLVLSVRVADADAARRRLVEAGVVTSAVDTQPWGHRSFELIDPDGHRLTLFETIGAGERRAAGEAWPADR